MKKLLHERLREIDNEERLGGFYLNGSWLVITAKQAQTLADEIERYYIPRPRFEDGEPVDLLNAPNGDDNVVFYLDGSGYSLQHDLDDHFTFEAIDEPVKRPQPKVLDADGVEIKVGDMVWHITGSYPWTVISIDRDRVLIRDSMNLDVDGCSAFAPNDLTHKEPDSLEKLQADIGDFVRRSVNDENRTEFNDLLDRFRALIEKMD